MVEKGGRKGYITERNRRSSWQWQAIITFRTCEWNEWMNEYVLLLLTYFLTPWCRVLLEKLIGLQLVKKFPAFHGTWRFITAFTSVHHLSLSWASPIQSIYPHPTSWRSILILSTYLCLGLPSGLLPSGFPSKTLYTPLSSSIHTTCSYVLLLPSQILSDHCDVPWPGQELWTHYLLLTHMPCNTKIKVSVKL